MIRSLLFPGLVALAACGAPADRYTVPTPTPSETIRIGFGSVEVREVSLPSYAAAEEIHLQDGAGVLKSSPEILWADAPERAIALELTRHLSNLTGARIASEPWPFEAFPDARLEIRFEQLLATADGRFRATGQYFVGVEEGRERGGLFDLTTTFDPEAGPAAVVRARGQLILDIARDVARRGLR